MALDHYRIVLLWLGMFDYILTSFLIWRLLVKWHIFHFINLCFFHLAYIHEYQDKKCNENELADERINGYAFYLLSILFNELEHGISFWLF